MIVITGRPASGKTTLAHALAKAVRCPVISRDEIKEGLVNTIKISDMPATNDLNRSVYTIFFETVAFLLDKGITLICEAAFQHHLWVPELESLKKVARIHLIICSINAQLAASRFTERGLADIDRAQFHDDWASKTSKEGVEYLSKRYEPPQLDVPTLKVDTSDGYQPTFEEIIAFAVNC